MKAIKKYSHALNYVLEHPEEYSVKEIERAKQNNKVFGELCDKLGVKRGCSFHVKLADHKRATIKRFNELCPYSIQTERRIGSNTYAFLSELECKGYYDGWSQWYGDNDHILQLLKEGILVVNKEQTKKTSLV